MYPIRVSNVHMYGGAILILLGILLILCTIVLVIAGISLVIRGHNMVTTGKRTIQYLGSVGSSLLAPLVSVITLLGTYQRRKKSNTKDE